jgi:vacuolar-type H+-ATPase subunit E/Vma4
MTFENIQKHISKKIDDFEKKKEDEFNDFCKNIENKYKRNFDEFKLKVDKSYSFEKNKIKQNILGEAKTKHNEYVNLVKSELIQKLKGEILNHFKSMNKKERESFYIKFISSLIDVIQINNYDKVICSRKDKELLDKLFSNYGIKFKYSLSDVDGFKLVSKDESEILDLSFESIINNYFQENMDIIIDKLFI